MSHVRDARHVGRCGLGQVVQDVVDRDRLDLVVHPLRCRHRRKPVGEVADHLERRRPRADHDPGLQHHGLDARVDRISPTSARDARCRDSSRVLRVQAAQVHQPPHPGPLRRRDHVACRPRLLGDEVLRRAHRVHQVVDDVDAVERIGQRVGFVRSPRTTSTSSRHGTSASLSGLRAMPARAAVVQQSRHQPATDVAGRARHQAANLLSRHNPPFIDAPQIFGADRRADARFGVRQTRNPDRAHRRTAAPAGSMQRICKTSGAGPTLRPMCT